MKTLVMLFAVAAVALAGDLGGYEHFEGGYESYGGHEHESQPKVIYGGKVVTRIFENPGMGYFNNYAPKIEGPLITKGYGPHVGNSGKDWH